MTRPIPRWLVLRALTACLSLTACELAIGQEKPPSEVGRDPAKTLGAEACQKCHTSEFARWMETPHFQTFDSLHRLPEAKEISSRLGISSVKRSDLCIRCHYTEQQQGSRVRVVSGVSCESCHGAAKDWLEVHADYGGPNVTRETETAAHRQQRRLSSIQAGMNNPVNVYLLARQCFNCHTAPNERLVNVGGHRPGTTDFELVSWSQGKVRHNFVRSNGQSNQPSKPERLRVMFVVGIMTDLEFSLRAVSVATEKSTFGVTSAKRAALMKNRLRAIAKLTPHPRIDEALEAVATVALTLGNTRAIEASADRVGIAAYQFAEECDGTTLEELDKILPDPSRYK